MALVTPQTALPNTTVTATDVTVPLATLGLTQAEAGNLAKLLHALLDQAYANYNVLATADKSARMTFSKGQQSLAGGFINQAFTVSFQLAVPDGLDVASEPA